MFDERINTDLEFCREKLFQNIANTLYPAGPSFKPTTDELVNSLELFIEEKIRVALGKPRIEAFGDK